MGCESLRGVPFDALDPFRLKKIEFKTAATPPNRARR